MKLFRYILIPILFFILFTIFVPVSFAHNYITYKDYINILNTEYKKSKPDLNKVYTSLLMLYLWQQELNYYKFVNIGEKWITKAKKIKNRDYITVQILSYLITGDSVEAYKLMNKVINKEKNSYIYLLKTFINSDYNLSKTEWNYSNALLALKNSKPNTFIYAISNYVCTEILKEKEKKDFITYKIKPNLNELITDLQNSINIDKNNLFFYLKKGEYFLVNQDYILAEEVFNKINNLNLDYCYSIIGNYYYQLGYEQTALNYYTQAIKTADKFDIFPYIHIEKIYLSNNKLKEIIEIYRQAIKKYPNEQELYVNLYNCLNINSSYNDRLNFLLESIKRFKSNTFFYQKLADLYLENYENTNNKNYLDKAIDCYKTILKLDKNLFKTYLSLANVYLLKKEHTLAINTLDKAIKLFPDYTPSYFDIIRIYSNINKFDKALEYAKRLLKKEPNNPYVYNVISEVYRYKKDYKNAQIYLYKSLKISENTDTYISLGDLYQEQKNYDKALYYYIKAKNLMPYNDYINYLIGNLLSDKGDYKEAHKYYVRAILINPKNLESRNNLGILYMKQKDIVKAINEFEKIIKLDPKNSIAYYNLACIYSLQNNKTLALTYLKQAIELNSSLKDIAKKDTDLKPLHNEREFLNLIK